MNPNIYMIGRNIVPGICKKVPQGPSISRLHLLAYGGQCPFASGLPCLTIVPASPLVAMLRERERERERELAKVETGHTAPYFHEYKYASFSCLTISPAQNKISKKTT